jgi:ubiquinone/menaquinone biosynthesis C-methylase UbiE
LLERKIMATQNAAFVGSIPENYDRYLGPVLFEPYARDLTARLNVPEDGLLLEIACGTGIVTRRLRDSLPPTVKIVATDLNEAMMNYARRKFHPDENIEWKQADATELTFDDVTFDAVVCQFGLMFVPDKAKAAEQAFRVLKPGAEFIFSVWDAIELNDLAHTAHTTVAKYFENEPPDFYQVPFSFHDPEAIETLLRSAGFNEIQVTPVGFPSKASSAREVSRGLVHGNPIIAALRERCEARIPEIEAEVASVVAAKYGDNPVRAKMRALVCSAVR